MDAVKHLGLALLLASAFVAPARAVVGQGQIGQQSKATISISVSVAPAVRLHKSDVDDRGFARLLGYPNCLESNLPLGFAITVESMTGALEPVNERLGVDVLAALPSECGQVIGDVATRQSMQASEAMGNGSQSTTIFI